MRYSTATGRTAIPVITLLCACVLLLLVPATCFCLSEGGGSLSLLNRYTGQNYSAAPETTLYESLLRLDLFQNVPGYGRLLWSSDLSRTDGPIGSYTKPLSRFQGGLEGFREGSWTSTILGGDVSIRFSNLVEGFPGPYSSLLSIKPFLASVYTSEPARFQNSAYPDIPLRGGVLSSAADKDSVLVFGGRLSEIKGFQSNEINPTDESLLGAKWVHKWSSDSYAGGGIIQSFGQQREGITGGAPFNNSILLLDGSHRLNRYVRLIGEFRGNIISGDSIADSAIKAGSMVTHPQGSIELNFRRIGPEFLFVRESLQSERDVEGVYASTDYKLNEHLMLYSSLDWNRTNLEGNRQNAALNSLSALLGGYFFHPHFPSINLRLSLSDRGSRETSSVLVDSRNYSIYLEMLKNFGLMTPYVRLQGEVSSDYAVPDNSSKTGTAGIGVRFVPVNLLNAYVEAESQTRSSDSGDKTESLRFKAGLSYLPGANLSLYADADYSTSKDTPVGTLQRGINLGCGAMATLPDSYYLNADVRYSTSSFSGFGSSDSSGLQATLGLVKRFGWGRASGAGALSGIFGDALMASAGGIEGEVYLDYNRNGLRDPGEPGLARVTIQLEDKSRAVTDSHGRYKFDNIATGVHIVSIDERGLDASLNLLTPASQRVEVKLRETTGVSYTIIKAGSIRGKVLVDANDNNSADSADTPLSDILIYLVDNRTNTFSDSDGNFVLDNMLPGSYEVRIDQAGLAEGMQLISPESLVVEVKSGEESANVVFLVAKEKKQVRKKVFGGGK
jgi:hypothetical protein